MRRDQQERREAMSKDKSLARRSEQEIEKAETRRTMLPAVDVYENDEEILLLADVPGVDKSGVEVRFDRDTLSITAKREASQPGNLIAGEYAPADYARSFVVPQSIDADGIKAELDRGVLKVHLPKPAAARPRQITVTAG
jgi:HSP20 family protein